MQSTDAKRFGELIAMTGEFYDKPVSEQRLVMWFGVLSDFDIADIERAVMTHMRESKWMPTPAELIERMRPNVAESAELAWVEVPRLLRNSRSARSDNEVTEQVISDLGGWIALGQKPESELVWVQKAFVDRYQTYANHGLNAADSIKRIPGERGGMRLIGGGK
jgi:hypothetical protein